MICQSVVLIYAVYALPVLLYENIQALPLVVGSQYAFTCVSQSYFGCIYTNFGCIYTLNPKP